MGDGRSLVFLKYLTSEGRDFKSSMIVGWETPVQPIRKMKHKAVEYVRKGALQTTPEKRHHEAMMT
jgi:hypothetical protein